MNSLLKVLAKPESEKCPFSNTISFTLRPGDCVWLQGPSGRGKTTLAMEICGLLQPSVLQKLGISVTCEWDKTLPVTERCGVLFQHTTLLDELTVAGNLAVALKASGHPMHERETRIKQLLDIVGLEYQRDGWKRPTELSGGMGRRASLALQLAQKKHVIVLDEPFTGLDYDVGLAIAKELVYLRKKHHVAFILISHEPAIAKQVLSPELDGNFIVKLEQPLSLKKGDKRLSKNCNIYRGISFYGRFKACLADYLICSIPLVSLSFLASGLAIAMLTCDTLQKIDVIGPVLSVVEKEVRPMIKLLTGQEASAMQLLGIKLKVTGMLNSTLPPAKGVLYSIGMAKLFVLEIGPLLTALLLCGRIGGSYTGKIATMRATSQTQLLKTLSISLFIWTWYPSFFAAVIAAPLLTSTGTFIALFAGEKIGSMFGIVHNSQNFWNEVKKVVFPDFHVEFTDSYVRLFIEVITYPPIYHLLKAVSYIVCILVVSEISAMYPSSLTPRRVPFIITQSIVISGLLLILMDWAFSQLWLKRQ